MHRKEWVMRALLWTAQVLVGVPFILIGYMKVATPIADLSKTIPWTGQLPEAFVRTMGIIDMAGGLGLLLPGLTRIKPTVTAHAALGCVLLQFCAIIFHVSRGEVQAIPVNLVFLPLAAFVFWGRLTRWPVAMPARVPKIPLS